jgi:hypothetical protein
MPGQPINYIQVLYAVKIVKGIAVQGGYDFSMIVIYN